MSTITPSGDVARHTPGPWMVSAVSATEVIGPRQRTICRAHRDAPTRSEAETRANARLIAAAPYLLKALIELTEAAEYWAGCDQGCTPDMASSEIMSSGSAWPAQAYDKARSAIARATGAA